MVPEDRREQLAGDDRDEERRLGGATRAATTTTPSGATTISHWIRRASRRDAGLVRDCAGREVVRRRDRVADVPEQRDEVRPGADAGEGRVATTASDRERATPTRTAREPAGEQRPDEDQRRAGA